MSQDEGGGATAAAAQLTAAQPTTAGEATASSATDPNTRKILTETCTTVPWPLAALCEKYQSPTLVTPSAAGAESGPKAARGSGLWQAEAWVPAARDRSRFLIAIVPDPELTRLSLYFDRAVDSIQRAAESTGFYFDRHWLPWTQDPSSSGRAISFTGDEPGMLLFRRSGVSEDYLVVFLVGESPVSGIRQRPFLKAVQYAKTIGNPAKFYVSGTSYSGALPSLRHAIEDARRLFLAGDSATFDVISGSATVKREMDAFRSGRGEQAKEIPFASVMHNDTFASRHFLDYIKRRWGGALPSAFLSEGQTAYGMGTATIQREMIPAEEAAASSLTIRFPREIARLRGAYPQPSMRTTESGVIPQGSPSAQLSVPLQEVQEGRDAVTTLSRAQLPVVQESVLLDIANTLQREDIRLTGIAGTDVFDSLFLAGFLRKATPNLRLYLDDTDLLYVRAGAQYSLDGVLAVTSYPLVTQNQVWSLGRTQNRWPQRSPASSRFELGTYNAARALLLKQDHARRQSGQPTEPAAGASNPIGTSTATAMPPLGEHSFPGVAYNNNPPLWLVTVGLNGYWPIALLDNGTNDESQLAWNAAAEGPDQQVLDLGRPDRVWSAVFSLLVAIGGVFGALTVGAQLPGFVAAMQGLSGQTRPPRESRLWSQFLVHPSERGAPGRAYFISVQCLALAAMLYPVASVLWLVLLEGSGGDVRYTSSENWIVPAACVSFASFLFLLAGALAPYATLLSVRATKGTTRDEEGSLAGNQYMHLAVATFIAFPFPLVFWWQGLAGQSDHSLFFFTYRSLDLLNGVSPATPFLLLGIGLMVMARLHGRRHILALEAPTALPAITEDFQTKGLKANAEEVSHSLSNPLTSDVGATLLILLPAFAVLLLIPSDRPQSLESWQYDLAYQITLRALFLFAALSWARFVLVWMKLHRVLEILDQHPLRATFSVLPSGYSTMPVFEGTGRLDSRDRLVHLAQDLRALASCKNVAPIPFLEPEELRTLERGIEEAVAHNPQALAGVWRRVASIGTELASRLEPEWSRGCGTVDEMIARRSEVPAEQRAFRIAEEIVAMPYLAFVGNAMLQLRNLLLYVTTSYFLGVISALVYPFRGVQMIVWAGTIGFVVLGTPVIVALIQMERDAILRRLARGKGAAGTFPLLRRLAVFGALPILAMFGSYFPGVGRYLIAWLEPAIKAF